MVREKGISQMTDSGFNELFEKYIPLTKTYREAYELAEIAHETLHVSRRYSDYKSFERVRNRGIKR